jgi:hypothetical protein
MYALVVLTGVADTENQEVTTKEFADRNSLINGIIEASTIWPAFRAITICHSEDLPLIMEGAKPVW